MNKKTAAITLSLLCSPALMMATTMSGAVPSQQMRTLAPHSNNTSTCTEPSVPKPNIKSNPSQYGSPKPKPTTSPSPSLTASPKPSATTPPAGSTPPAAPLTGFPSPGNKTNQ